MSDIPTRPTPTPGLFAILIAMSAVGPLALNIFIPSMPGLQRELAASHGTVQLTLTLYLVGMAVCQLFYGPLSDRYGRRPLVLAGLSLFVVSNLAAALATSIHMLIAARLLQAMGASAGIVLARTIVRDLYDRDKSASVIGYITMAFVLAPMIAPSLGGLLDMVASWRASFWLLTVLGTTVLAAAWLGLPETNLSLSRTPLLSPRNFAHLLRLRRFRGYALTLGLASSVFFSFLAGAPFVTIELLGRTPFEYGLWFLLISLGYMMGNYLTGRYSQAVGIDRMISIGNMLTLAGGLLCLFGALVGILSPASLFLPMMLAAFGNGLTIPNGTAGAISVDMSMVGAAAGLAGFLQMALGAGASQLVGTIQSDFPMAVFWCMAAASLAAAAAHAWSRRT